MAFSEAQLQAIRHGDGPALVLAGPGSGKTTVITNRIRYLIEEEGVNPSSILVITFTRAAAREMQARYEQMTQTGCKGPAFGTFHSVFFLILKLAYRYDAGSIVREEQRTEYIRDMLRQYGGRGGVCLQRPERDQHGEGGHDRAGALLCQELLRGSV